MIHDVLHRLRAIFRRSVVEREVDEELRHHFDLQMNRYLADGWTRETAVRQARLDIGGFDQVKEEHRDARGTRGREDLFRDARVAIRMLRRAPVFAATAVSSAGGSAPRANAASTSGGGWAARVPLVVSDMVGSRDEPRSRG